MSNASKPAAASHKWPHVNISNAFSRVYAHLTPQLESLKERTTRQLNKMQELTNTATAKFEQFHPPFASASSKNMMKFIDAIQTSVATMSDRHACKDKKLPPARRVDAYHNNLLFLAEYKQRQLPAASNFHNPYILLHILTYCGNVEVVSRFGMLNHAIRSLITREQRLWRFCVRYGGVSDRFRCAYWKHLTCSMELKKTHSFLDYVTLGQQTDWSEAIWIDVKRTPGRLVERMDRDTLERSLAEILHGLAGKYEHIGYCQGMDYLVANVLRVTCEANVTSETIEDSFWVVVALFEVYGLQDMFSPGLERLHQVCHDYRCLVAMYFPELSGHFKTQEILLEMFSVGWFQTLFTYHDGFPISTINRIWDIFLYEHDFKIVFRVALAILSFTHESLLRGTLADAFPTITTFHAPCVQEHGLVPEGLNMKVTTAMLGQLRDHPMSL